MSGQTTPLKAIRAHCLWCCGGIEEAFETQDGEQHTCYRPFREVAACPSATCPLHPFRRGKRTEPASAGPLRSIQEHCFGCLGGLGDSVKLGSKTYTRARPNRLISRCQREWCDLFPYRHGKAPSTQVRDSA